MAAFGLFMSLANQASAAPCNMEGCSVAIAADAGVTALKCLGLGGIDGCSCTAASTGCTSVQIKAAGSTCTGNVVFEGNLVDGRLCCGYGATCVKKVELEAIQEEIRAINEAGLDEVFGNSMDENRADTYYGYVDGSNRSPTNGRGNSASAKLDACLFHTDVDAITAAGGTMADKLARCYGSTYGCGTTLKNEHCNATGTNDTVSVSAAVCKDRCDCLYAGNCEGL